MSSYGPGGPSADDAQGSLTGDDDLGKTSREMLARLTTTVEAEIIPRLMLALDSSRPRAAPAAEPDVNPADSLDEFVRLLLTHDARVANRYVAELRARGAPLAGIYLDLLAPAARRLGTMWETDECSFVDVTLGLCRMHEVLLEFSRCFDARRAQRDRGRNALILPAPGEQHTFGLFMVMEFFRRDGWNCYTGTPGNGHDFQQLVRTREFDAIGISVSASAHLDAAAEQIARIRARPGGDRVVVLVGGHAFADQPELAESIGANACAVDARDGVRKVNRLCGAGTKGP
jgi:methanogenic corrinoid protein MtbC1